MRKTLSILLILLLLIGLLSGCDEEEEPTEVTTQATNQPAETTIPTEETTAPVEETTSPAEEPTESTDAAEIVEESPLNTAVLRSGDEELQAEYILLAVNPEGPFHSEVTLNKDGADALIHWLMSKQARTILESYGRSEFGEAVYSISEEAESYGGWIPSATEENQTIHLSVADTIEESGLLDVLLPLFEESFGYTVEVQTASASGTLTTAKLGIFDLVLTEKTSATESFVVDGYARVVDGFESEMTVLCGSEYLLCGPKDDPAGVAECATLSEAFAAIAKGEHIFLSRGDGSTVQKKEESFWPVGQEFGEWYLSVDTGMGPLLVMNEFEGGYILTDKLTWLQYFQDDGII